MGKAEHLPKGKIQGITARTDRVAGSGQSYGWHRFDTGTSARNSAVFGVVTTDHSAFLHFCDRTQQGLPISSGSVAKLFLLSL